MATSPTPEPQNALEAAEISEAVTVQPAPGGGVVDANGNVPVHIIRPGVGRGKGKHLYEADMLERNAQKFSGWRMFVNHRSPEARKAAGGLPRDVRDLGGRIVESWWDPNVPADPAKGWSQGAVVGKARPVRFIRELVEDDPEIIETSISATATGVRPVTRGGERVWLVEGIADKGSVDWVTEAGAGGRVATLMESIYSDENEVETALLESYTDSEINEYLRTERPELVEALADPAPAPPAEGGDMIKPEDLLEAAKSEEFQGFVSTLVEARLEEAKEETDRERAEERELIRAEARADAGRAIQLTRMEVAAHRQIDEARLPDSWKNGVKAEFSLDEATYSPTDALDLLDDVDGEGNVTKTAFSKLTEAVREEIGRQQTKLREASTTRVSGQGPSDTPDTDGGDKPVKPSETNWGKHLQETGVSDIDSAYALQGAGSDA